MTTKNLHLLFIIALFSFSKSVAQEKYYFREGLAIVDVHRYGREALYTDAVAQQLYQGQLKPAEGASFHYAEGRPDTRWQLIKGDSVGNFRGASMGNGYLYLTYDAPKAELQC